MTSYAYYTDKLTREYISHDDDEGYALTEGHFPYTVVFEIDITDSQDNNGKVFLVITDRLDKIFLKFVTPSSDSDAIDVNGYRRAFAYACNCRGNREKNKEMWYCTEHGKRSRYNY